MMSTPVFQLKDCMMEYRDSIVPCKRMRVSAFNAQALEVSAIDEVVNYLDSLSNQTITYKELDILLTDYIERMKKYVDYAPDDFHKDIFRSIVSVTYDALDVLGAMKQDNGITGKEFVQ